MKKARQLSLIVSKKLTAQEKNTFYTAVKRINKISFLCTLIGLSVVFIDAIFHKTAHSVWPHPLKLTIHSTITLFAILLVSQAVGKFIAFYVMKIKIPKEKFSSVICTSNQSTQWSEDRSFCDPTLIKNPGNFNHPANITGYFRPD